MRKRIIQFVTKETAEQYAKEHRMKVEPVPVENSSVFNYKLPRVPAASTTPA